MKSSSIRSWSNY